MFSFLRQSDSSARTHLQMSFEALPDLQRSMARNEATTEEVAISLLQFRAIVIRKQTQRRVISA